VNSPIYEKSYRKIADADIVSAFLETPSDEAIMKLMGHMLLMRDPNVPAKPTSAQRRQVQAGVEVWRPYPKGEEDDLGDFSTKGTDGGEDLGRGNR